MAVSGFSTSNYALGAGVITSVPLTMSCWGKVTTLSGWQQLMGLYNTGSAGNRNSFRLLLDSGTGKLVASASNGSDIGDAFSSTAVSTNVWFHAAAVFYTNSSRAVFANGGGKGTNSSSRTPSGINSLVLGARGGASIIEPLAGALADVNLWNVDLSDEEIALLAKGIPSRNIRPANLISPIPLVRSAVDLKGAPPSIVGSLSIAEHPPTIVIP